MDATGTANDIFTAALLTDLPDDFVIPILGRKPMHLTIGQWPDGTLEVSTASVDHATSVVFSSSYQSCDVSQAVVTIRGGLAACSFTDSLTRYSWSEDGRGWLWISGAPLAAGVDDVYFLTVALPATL